jgi:nucleoside-diphosphate-sugar epimerase
MKRVLVTGANGFIGRQSLEPLLKRGYEIHAVYMKKPATDDPRIHWHQANLLDADASQELCAAIKPTHLLHFAWYVHPKDYKISPENDH